MYLLLTAFIVVASPPVMHVTPRQAQATVLILPFASLHFADIERSDPARLRSTEINSGVGGRQLARLIEFQ
jgi:hypothetical protein